MSADKLAMSAMSPEWNCYAMVLCTHLTAIAKSFEFARPLMVYLLTVMLGYAFAAPNLQTMQKTKAVESLELIGQILQT